MKLPKVVWKLGWVSFFADVASEMVYPLIPLFLTGPLGAPKAVLGLVEGVAEATVSFMKVWSGIGSDRRQKRKPYIVFGYGLSAIGKPILGIASIWPIALVARGIDRVGKGLRTTARDALIADAVEKEQRGSAFGVHRSLDTAGALVGVGVAALILALYGHALTKANYQTIFLVAGIPGIISVLIALRVSESVGQSPNGSIRTIPWRQVIGQLPAAYWLTAALFGLFSIANSSDTFVLLRGKELGYTPLMVIGAYALYNVAYMLFSYPAGRLSDRIGRWPVIAAGWLLYGAVYYGLAMSSAGLLPALLLLYGVYIGLTKAVGTALVADHAPEEWKGVAMGIFHLISGVATIGGNVLAGFLWDNSGSKSTFMLGAGLALLATIGAVMMWRSDSRPPQGLAPVKSA